MTNPMNRGHGHVRPRPDGVKARCGGPSICKVCQDEQLRLDSRHADEPLMPTAMSEMVQALLRNAPRCPCHDTPMRPALPKVGDYQIDRDPYTITVEWECQVPPPSDPYYAVAMLPGSGQATIIGRARTDEQARAIIASKIALGNGMLTLRVLTDLGALPFNDERGMTEVLLTDPVLHAIYEYGRREGIAQREQVQADSTVTAPTMRPTGLGPH